MAGRQVGLKPPLVGNINAPTGWGTLEIDKSAGTIKAEMVRGRLKLKRIELTNCKVRGARIRLNGKSIASEVTREGIVLGRAVSLKKHDRLTVKTS